MTTRWSHAPISQGLLSSLLSPYSRIPFDGPLDDGFFCPSEDLFLELLIDVLVHVRSHTPREHAAPTLGVDTITCMGVVRVHETRTRRDQRIIVPPRVLESRTGRWHDFAAVVAFQAVVDARRTSKEREI